MPKEAMLRPFQRPVDPAKKHNLSQPVVVKQRGRGRPPRGQKRCIDLDLWSDEGEQLPAISLTSMGLRIEGTKAEFERLISRLT